jgi:hypothetical protein
MAGSVGKIKKYLNVEKHKIYTKIPARIILDLEDYKELNENYGEEVGIAEIENIYEIPGFFTLEFPEEGDSIDFFFPYLIYLHKTDKIQESKDKIIIDFKADDLIFYANYKEDETNIYILKSLFENGVKYLGDKPDKLVSAIWQQLMPANTPWHHLEILVSQLYGTYDKTSKEFVPLRLTSHTYSKKYIMNLKESAHNLNQSLPFQYGYSKDALRTMVSKKKRGKNSFFENIISGDYDELTKEYQKSDQKK